MIPKNDRVAAEIFRLFEKKYRLGALAVAEAISITSLYVNDDIPVSMMVIAPTGQMKTALMKDMLNIFPNYIFEIDSRFTPYGLSRNIGGDKLNMKCMFINDMVRTLDTLDKIKIKELSAWLAELFTEGRAGSETAKEAKIEARTCMIGNIALGKYREVAGMFKSSTLSERVLQFYFKKTKKEIREKTDSKLKIEMKIELEKCSVAIPKHFKKKIWELSDKLAILQQYEAESLRTDQIIKSFLKSYALLNGRNAVNNSDMHVFEWLMPNMKRVI